MSSKRLTKQQIEVVERKAREALVGSAMEAYNAEIEAYDKVSRRELAAVRRMAVALEENPGVWLKAPALKLDVQIRHCQGWRGDAGAIEIVLRMPPRPYPERPAEAIAKAKAAVQDVVDAAIFAGDDANFLTVTLPKLIEQASKELAE